MLDVVRQPSKAAVYIHLLIFHLDPILTYSGTYLYLAVTSSRSSHSLYKTCVSSPQVPISDPTPPPPQKAALPLSLLTAFSPFLSLSLISLVLSLFSSLPFFSLSYRYSLLRPLSSFSCLLSLVSCPFSLLFLVFSLFLLSSSA